MASSKCLADARTASVCAQPLDVRVSRLETLFTFAIAAVEKSLIDATVPLNIIEDALDVEPVHTCEQLWEVLERQRDVLMKVALLPVAGRIVAVIARRS